MSRGTDSPKPRLISNAQICALLDTRHRLRIEQRYNEADAILNGLKRDGIIVDDLGGFPGGGSKTKGNSSKKRNRAEWCSNDRTRTGFVSWTECAPWGITNSSVSSRELAEAGKTSAQEVQAGKAAPKIKEVHKVYVGVGRNKIEDVLDCLGKIATVKKNSNVRVGKLGNNYCFVEFETLTGMKKVLAQRPHMVLGQKLNIFVSEAGWVQAVDRSMRGN